MQPSQFGSMKCFANQVAFNWVTCHNILRSTVYVCSPTSLIQTCRSGNSSRNTRTLSVLLRNTCSGNEGIPSLFAARPCYNIKFDMFNMRTIYFSFHSSVSQHCIVAFIPSSRRGPLLKPLPQGSSVGSPGLDDMMFR